MLKIHFENAQLLLDYLESLERVLLDALLHPIEGCVEELPELVVTRSFSAAIRTECKVRRYVTVAGMAGRELAHIFTINLPAGPVQS